MKLMPLFILSVAMGLPASSNARAEDQLSRDRVTTDRAGREVTRVRTLSDGRTETTHVTWEGERRQAVSSETTDANGRVVQRSLKRFDAKGRPSELRLVDVDDQGHERGWRKIYTYGPKGSPRERTFTIE